jgi:Tfp pilus assembly PilM family ATPase
LPFSFLRPACTPVLADFGASGVKLLQLAQGEPRRALAAASIDFPDAIRTKPLDARLAHVAAELPRALRSGPFRGRRVVVAPFTQHVLVQHVALPASDADFAGELIRTQLAISLACDPSELVVRTNRVAETVRNGESRVETIAFAMSRHDAMRYVDLFRAAGLTVAALHSGIAGLMRAFTAASRAQGGSGAATMFADLGFGGTKVAICHGDDLVFAKSIPFTGRASEARSVESLAEDLSMCVRYHGALFGDAPIRRVVFVGGESRDRSLWQSLAESLHLTAMAGDPLAALIAAGAPSGLPEPASPHPGWAVACGLANAPTDL